VRGAPGTGGGAVGATAGDDAGAGDAAAGNAGASTVDGGGIDPAPGDDAATPLVIHYVPGVAVSTLAGSDVPGIQDGTGGAAHFDNPTGMAIDADGNLLVTDYDTAHVRLVTPAGAVTTIAAAPAFVNPFAAVVASDGSYYVETDADETGTKGTNTGTIWRVVPLGGGALATPTVVARGLYRPRALAPIAGGDLFVLDRTEDVAERLSVTSGEASLLAGAAGATGYVDGTGASARFASPVGVAAMSDGSFLLSDSGNHRIRRITAGGVVDTFAGNGVGSLVDGPCASASFRSPRGVAIDAAGNVFVNDGGNHVIRRIRVDCTVETVAGATLPGFHDGDGDVAAFYGQEGMAVTPSGKTVYVADGNGGDGSAHHRVRAIAIP
jgi:hypothetical protein